MKADFEYYSLDKVSLYRIRTKFLFILAINADYQSISD